MMNCVRLYSLVAFVAVTGCVTVSEADEDPVRTPYLCDADDARKYIGLRPEDVPEIEGQIIRVLTENSAATLDFRVERLNLFVTGEGIIESVTCG